MTSSLIEVYAMHESGPIPLSMGDGCEEQLAFWLLGKPLHNRIRDECCPDFSCCQPELLWPEDRRREFVYGSDEKRNQMCVGALVGLLECTGNQVQGAWILPREESE